MKESRTWGDNTLVFREPFNDETSVIRNGGVPANIVFSLGAAEFNGLETASGGHMEYNNVAGINNTDCSIQIRFNCIFVNFV